MFRVFIADVERRSTVLIGYREYIGVDDDDIAEHVVVNIAAERYNTVNIKNHGLRGQTLIQRQNKAVGFGK